MVFYWKEKAVEIADRLGVDFTPSDGWLDRFKNRTGLVYKTICGEVWSVNMLLEEKVAMGEK
jgi:hypothetical protein